MENIRGLYFVIVSRAQARFVRPDLENGLHTVGSLALTTGPEPTGFLPVLAKRIGDDLSVDLFTDLVLVAPAEVLQELQGLIDPATAASLVGTLARDLMTVPDLELWPHLLPWIHPCRTDRAPPVPSHN
jgi:Bacterial archaeo-eukaryotic release factor family 12